MGKQYKVIFPNKIFEFSHRTLRQGLWHVSFWNSMYDKYTLLLWNTVFLIIYVKLDTDNKQPYYTTVQTCRRARRFTNKNTHVVIFCKDPCGTVVANKTLSTATVILFSRPYFTFVVMSLSNGKWPISWFITKCVFTHFKQNVDY